MQSVRALACIAGLAGWLSICAGVQAQLHGGDVILSSDGARVMTNTANGAAVAPARVWQQRFGSQGPAFVNRVTNPGFNSVSGAYPAGQITGVTIRRAARKWADGNFCTVPVETLTVTKNGVTATTPAADPVGDPAQISGLSVTLGITGDDGFIHEHPGYAVTSPFSDGVYLLELQAWVGSPAGQTPGASEPFWIVLGQNAAAQDLGDAVNFVANGVAAQSGSLLSLLCPDAVPPCAADFNGSGTATVQDIFDFLGAWFSGDTGADVNGSGSVTVQDIFDFLAAWFAGC